MLALLLCVHLQCRGISEEEMDWRLDQLGVLLPGLQVRGCEGGAGGEG